MAEPRTRAVWIQQYYRGSGEHGEKVVLREASGHGLPPGKARIVSPYDTGARYSQKHGKGWLGDKVPPATVPPVTVPPVTVPPAAVPAVAVPAVMLLAVALRAVMLPAVALPPVALPAVTGRRAAGPC